MISGSTSSFQIVTGSPSDPPGSVIIIVDGEKTVCSTLKDYLRVTARFYADRGGKAAQAFQEFAKASMDTRSDQPKEAGPQPLRFIPFGRGKNAYLEFPDGTQSRSFSSPRDGVEEVIDAIRIRKISKVQAVHLLDLLHSHSFSDSPSVVDVSKLPKPIVITDEGLKEEDVPAAAARRTVLRMTKTTGL